MGNAKFYFYPQPDGRHLVEIDMGQALGELATSVDHDVVDGVTYSGGIHRSVGTGGEVVNLQRDRMQLSETLANKFDALQNHLDRGYSVAFSPDSSKAWAASVQTAPNGGALSLPVKNNPFAAFTGTSTVPSANDYMVLETDSPNYIREIIKISSISVTASAGGSVVPYNRINFTYAGRRVFARWYRFYPVLKRPASEIGRPIITNEGGRLFSLNVTLVPDYETLFAFHNGEGLGTIGPSLIGASAASGTIPSNQGAFSLDEAGAGFPRQSVEDPSINTSVLQAIQRGRF